MISQVMKRYKDFKFSCKWAVKASGFFVSLFLVSYFYTQFNQINYFSIKDVKVVGIQHLDQQEVQRLLLPLVRKGFFTVDVERIRECLLQLPWIGEAYVRRIWPNQIVIRVVEKVPLARWNSSSLLSTAGDIFTPMPLDTLSAALPQFNGPEGEQIHMLNYYSKIKALVRPLHSSITCLELTSAGFWRITFANGMKLNAGYKDILTQIGHFVKVYPHIIGKRASDIDYVDLRYHNGVAVRWKTMT